MTLFFLPFFYIKERHYNKPPIFPCKSSSTLTFSTTAGVVEMLYPVVTLEDKFKFRGAFKDELKLCFTNLTFSTINLKGWISILFTFSTRKISSYFTFISLLSLLSLNNLPSVLYKCEGWR